MYFVPATLKSISLLHELSFLSAVGTFDLPLELQIGPLCQLIASITVLDGQYLGHLLLLQQSLALIHHLDESASRGLHEHILITVGFHWHRFHLYTDSIRHELYTPSLGLQFALYLNAD